MDSVICEREAEAEEKVPALPIGDSCYLAVANYHCAEMLAMQC